MPLSQQKFREIVLQLLYSQDLDHSNETSTIELLMTELAVSKKNVRLAQERVQHIQQHLSEIDSLITSVSTSYNFDRIQVVTKNILRLGIFEIFFDEKIPPKVAIAEAIRLSRKFNTPESASFVNALLDHLYQISLGEVTNLQKLAQQAEAFQESERIAFEISQEESFNEKQKDTHDTDGEI